VKTSNAILTISVGCRNFTKYTLPSIREYSERIKADFILHDTFSFNYELENAIKKIKPQRTNIRPYIQKIVSISNLLEKYKKVLLLDDTCIVSRKAKNIFFESKNYGISAYYESEHNDFNSHVIDKKFIFKRRNFKINNYFNTGVLVVNQNVKKIFDIEQILLNIDLFESKYPDQAYLNYLVEKNNIDCYPLQEEWNFMAIEEYKKEKNRKLKALPDEYVKSIENNNIFHITGYYQNRFNIIKQLQNPNKYSHHPFVFLRKALNNIFG